VRAPRCSPIFEGRPSSFRPTQRPAHGLPATTGSGPPWLACILCSDRLLNTRKIFILSSFPLSFFSLVRRQSQCLSCNPPAPRPLRFGFASFSWASSTLEFHPSSFDRPRQLPPGQQFQRVPDCARPWPFKRLPYLDPNPRRFCSADSPVDTGTTTFWKIRRHRAAECGHLESLGLVGGDGVSNLASLDEKLTFAVPAHSMLSSTPPRP
jgi:hypothetical protein